MISKTMQLFILISTILRVYKGPFIDYLLRLVYLSLKLFFALHAVF